MNWLFQFFLVVAFAIVNTVVPAAIPQDPLYHRFAGDGLTWCCAGKRAFPNMANVLSNIPFALVGFYGLWMAPATIAWNGFSWGSIFVALGSAYYHWNPNNETLVWDRLPMTLCTTSISFVLLQHYVALDISDLILWWLVGFLSVLYWSLYGNLLFYAFVQYFPVLLILFLSVVNPVAGSSTIIAAIALYVVARVCEYFDAWFFQHCWVSGHVVKHILCAVSMFLLFIPQI